MDNKNWSTKIFVTADEVPVKYTKYGMQNSRRLPNVICLQSFDTKWMTKWKNSKVMNSFLLCLGFP